MDENTELNNPEIANPTTIANDNTVTYDKAKLEEVKQKIDKIAEDIDEAFEIIVRQIKFICDGENFDEETRQLLNEVLELIDVKKKSYVDSLFDMSGFLSSLIELFTANENKISSEIKDWLATFKTVGEGVKAGYTAQGATQGMDTVKTATQELVDSGIKISGYTREIVKESANMIASGGKLIKGLTGSSPQELVQKGVGTIATLFEKTASNPGSSITSQLFGRLGRYASDFFNGIVGSAA